MDELRILFAQTIRRAVRRFTEEDDQVSRIVEHLVSSVGISSLELTVHVREEDFSNYVLPVEARILKTAFEALSNPGADHQGANGGAHRVNPDPINAEGPNVGGAQDRQPRGRNDNFTIDWKDIYNIDSKIKTRLQSGRKLRKHQRKSLVSRIVLQVRNRVPHATRKTFVTVMKAMKLKYAESFRLELLNGSVGKTSITAAMQNKFDNDRRPKRRTNIETEAPNIKAAYGCVKWRLSRLPIGETEETQEEKRKELVNIFFTERPRAWNWENINQLIDLTYASQRLEINRQAELIEKSKKAETKAKRTGIPVPVERENEDDPGFTTAAIRDRWPFLFTANGMKHHFNFLTSKDLDAQINNFIEEKLDNMLEFLLDKKQSKNKRINRRMKTAIQENADPNSCKFTAMVLMTANYFKEDKESLIKLVEKTTKEENVEGEFGGAIPATPRLVIAGDCIFQPRNLFLCMDGTVCGSPRSLLDGVCMLFAAYYVFNLQYDAKAQITLEFLQRCVIGINPDKGNKRPTRAETILLGGRYSSTREHQALSQMSLSVEEFFEEQRSDLASEESEQL